VDHLVAALTRDLRLDASQRYELASLGKRLAGMSDSEVRAEGHSLATRSTSRSMGGAINLLALGLVEGRKTAFMTTSERRAYEAANYSTVGASGLDDSGVVDPEEIAEEG
jgi:hypothetical protein